MPSVIDELIVRISFDIQDLKKSSAAADAQLKGIREQAEVTGKRMEESGKRAAGFFAAAKVEAISLLAVLSGGAGLMSALAGTASGMADLGRAAVNLNNMSPERLDAWGQALKRIGGSADDAVQSFNNIGAALARQKLMGGSGGIMPFLNAIGAQRTMTPEQVAIKFSEYVAAHPEKTNQELNVIGGGLGMSQSLINLLRTGPAAVAKELELSKQLGLRTADMIKVATEFQRDWEALNQAARHVTDLLAKEMMPTMGKVVRALTAWIVEDPSRAEGAALIAGSAGSALGFKLLGQIPGFSVLSAAVDALALTVTRVAGFLGLLTLHGDTPDTPQPKETWPTRLGDWVDSQPWMPDWLKADRNRGGTGKPSKTLPGPRVENVPPGPRAGTVPSAPSGPVQLTTITTPSGQRVTVNAQHAEAFKGFLADLEASGYKIHSLGGYNDRNIAGTNIKSKHATGDAIDINPGTNPDTGRGGALVTDMPSNIREMARKWGLEWGGDWISKKDAMHFEIPTNRRPALAGPRAVPLPVPALLDPNLHRLLPSAGERERDPEFRASSNTNNTDIGHITIHTAATNAHGIAKELHGAISDKLIRDSNRGLV